MNYVKLAGSLALWLQGFLPAAARAVEHGEPDFGRKLTIVRSLGLGGSMDAAVDGDTLYVVGRGNLHAADVSDPAAPRIVGRLTGLDNTRQIEVRRGVAYVTAREDGLFVVDVASPHAPALLSHYDTIELATGIALSGDVALVACRTAARSRSTRATISPCGPASPTAWRCSAGRPCSSGEASTRSSAVTSGVLPRSFPGRA